MRGSDRSTDACLAQAGLDVLHQKKEAERIGSRWLEPEPLLECLGSFLFGVDHNRAAADDVGGLHGT
jgi:hypothetical protein